LQMGLQAFLIPLGWLIWQKRLFWGADKS
jgi:hypothetical protein